MRFNSRKKKKAGAVCAASMLVVVSLGALLASAAELGGSATVSPKAGLESVAELGDSTIVAKTSQAEIRSNRHTQYVAEGSAQNGDVVSPYGLDGYTLRLESEELQVWMKDDSGQVRIMDRRSGYLWGLSPDEKPAGLNKTWYQKAASLCSIVYYNEDGSENQASTESPDTKLDFTYNADNVECHVDMEKIGISFTVQMRLENEELSLKIAEGSLEEKGDCMIKELSFLPFLGSTLEDEIPGYFFVPDGCGALIRFQKAITYTSGIEGRIYGKDPGIDSLMDATNLMASRGNDYMVEENVMTMPVFGIVHGEGQNGIMAIINSGVEQAYITASASGYLTKYNWVTAKFAYRTSYMKPINKAGTGIYTAQEERNEIDPAITYIFLNGEDAGYSNMAVCYRDLLYEEGVLEAATEIKDETPLWISMIGGEIQKGILFDTLEVFTTIEQGQSITKDLMGRGISNLSVALYGWEKGGLNGADYGETSLERKLGKNSALKEWRDLLETAGGEFYLYKNVGRANVDQISKRSQAVINMSNAYAAYSVDNSDLMYPDAYLIKPGIVVDAIKELGKDMKGYSACLDYVGNSPLSDYTRGGNVTRKETMERFAAAVDSMENGHVAVFDPSQYMWNCVDSYLDIPMSNSQYIFETDSVPFLQMVLKGAMDYYVPYMNLGFYSDYTILKTIEYGACPSFIVADAQSYELADTPLENMFSVNYEDWSGNIENAYKKISQVLDQVHGAKITGHEMVAAGVASVSYNNGRTILVNYNSEEVVCDGETVPALGCLVKGGNQ